MLRLFAFFYGGLHVLSHSWLDKGLVLSDFLKDVAKRPFILNGSSVLQMMTPLALNSFTGPSRRSAHGARHWQMLHRAVYVIVLLGLLHFFWMRATKNNFAEVLVHAAVISLLLDWRVRHRRGAHRSLRPTDPPIRPVASPAWHVVTPSLSGA